MTKLNLITKDTDLSKVKIIKYDWDVEINDVPYQVVQLEGYYHTILFRHGLECLNDMYVYPRNEEMCFENLIEWNDTNSPVLWGITYTPMHYFKCRDYISEIMHYNKVIITRNGKPFCDSFHSIEAAQEAIDKFREHPIEFDTYTWKDKLIGRKVWFDDQPAIVTDYVDGQACVILKPEEGKYFKVPSKFKNESYMHGFYEESDVKVEVLSKSIWWFRE